MDLLLGILGFVATIGGALLSREGSLSLHRTLHPPTEVSVLGIPAVHRDTVVLDIWAILIGLSVYIFGFSALADADLSPLWFLPVPVAAGLGATWLSGVALDRRRGRILDDSPSRSVVLAGDLEAIRRQCESSMRAVGARTHELDVHAGRIVGRRRWLRGRKEVVFELSPSNETDSATCVRVVSQSLARPTERGRSKNARIVDLAMERLTGVRLSRLPPEQAFRERDSPTLNYLHAFGREILHGVLKGSMGAPERDRAEGEGSLGESSDRAD